VVRPLPVETMCWSLPSMFMMKIWSHFTSPWDDWKISFLAVGGEIGLGILSAEGQLVHVAQMLFLRRGQIGRVRDLRGRRLQTSEVKCEQNENR
jgi:hypothetical protein